MSNVWIACDCCGYCGAMAVLELTTQPPLLLSELIGAFALGRKGRRSCAPARFGPNLDIHLCRMAETAVSRVQHVAGAQIGLLNDRSSCFLLSLRHPAQVNG